MKTNFEQLSIGSKIFLVHKRYVDENLENGKIIVCRVKSFCNKNGEIFPIYAEVGKASNSPDAAVHKLYTSIEDAIDAIRTKPKKK